MSCSASSPEKFAGTGVDFTELQAWYEEKMK
jgi:hypothetical protein